MINGEDLDQMGYWDDWEDNYDAYITDPMWYSETFSRVTQQVPTPSLYATLIQEEFDEWRSEYLHQNHLNEVKELADLLYVIYGYAYSQGWDISEALHRVHNNNIERIIQDDGTIHRREDGKILKNPKAEKVKLGDLI